MGVWNAEGSEEPEEGLGPCVRILDQWDEMEMSVQLDWKKLLSQGGDP